MGSDPFRIRDHVADFDNIVSEIVQASARARETLPMIADIAYGTGPSETVDLFFPAGHREGLPVHIFIHGGYWRMWSKREYSYVARPITDAGGIAVIVDYSLMPDVRMEVLVDQVFRAKAWVRDHISEHGGDPASITISGHSAGAHLASHLIYLSPPGTEIIGALLLGGLYDLRPLKSSFLQSEINLTEEEIERFTPLHHFHDPGCRVILAVGEQETNPFHTQMSAFSDVLRRQGVPVAEKVLRGRNHMSSVRDLGIAGTEANDVLLELLQSTTKPIAGRTT
ncbi:alpha/beta hydrolase [Rhizobium sp. 2MFCol3.1]|uniref:alpha/beta hydrolase n=1 Tax=Rhizobium sp. 2MFCol3.1 TaxID=1246459 RepID=UPI0003727A1C|nr:alpha/beta hydrolase [Rhizobium sp. 2MFCol3.1]